MLGSPSWGVSVGVLVARFSDKGLMVIERLRNLILLPRKYPLRVGLVLLVVAPVAGFGGRCLWAEQHFRAAQHDLEHLDFRGGIVHLKSCLRIWPTNVETHFLLARTARRAGALDDAQHELDVCEQLGGRSEAMELERMLLRVQRGDVAGLDDYLQERAEAESPETPLILEALTQGYLRIVDLRSALTCINRILERRSNHVPALLWHAQAMEYLDRNQEAVADYRQVLEIDPDEKSARLSLGAVLLRLHQYRDALAHFEYLAEHPPEDPRVRLGIACALRGMGQAEQARPLLDDLMKEHPEEARVLFERGRLAQDDNQQALAEELLRKAYAGRPFDVQMMYALYQCLENRGKQAEAKTLLTKLQQLEQDKKKLLELTKEGVEKGWTSDRRVEAGDLCFRLGMMEEACNYFRAALRELPRNIRALEGLAEYYERSGDFSLAGEYRRRAYTLQHGN